MPEVPESTRPAGEAGGQPADDAPAAEDIPELHQIERVDQLRALSDRLRVRIVELLSQRAKTVAQLSEELGLAHAKVYYHVRELEQVELVRLVATREKGGILEKYYRTVARGFAISSALLRSMPADESVATIAGYVQQLFDDALKAFALDLRAGQPGTHVGTLSDTTLYLTDDEVRPVLRQVADLLKPYETARGREGERERTFVHLLYATPPVADRAEPDASAEPATPPTSGPRPPIAPAPPSPVRPPRPPQPPERPATGKAARPRPRTMVVAGLVAFSRADLEHAVARGEPIRLNVLGRCHFDADIPAELVERAIARFRLRGTLDASAEVRAVLERKQRPDQNQKEEKPE